MDHAAEQSEYRAWWPAHAARGGWWLLIRRLYDEVNTDRVLTVAGGVAFFSLLALVPAMTAAVSLYGLVADRADVARHVADLSGVIPAEGMAILSGQLERIVTAGGSALTLTGLVALLIAVWSALGGVKALIEGLNAAYGVYETRGFVRLNLTALAFTAGATVLLFVLSLALAASPRLMAALALGTAGEVAVGLIRWPLTAGLMGLALAALYAWGPSRPAPDLRWITPGAVLATAGFLAFSILFGWYAANLADFAGTYGSLGGVIGFLLWIWLTTVIVLVGAELNSIEDQATPRPPPFQR